MVRIKCDNIEQRFAKQSPRPAASGSPGSLLQVQLLRFSQSYQVPNSGAGVGSLEQHDLQVVLMHAKAEDHWARGPDVFTGTQELAAIIT